MHSQLLSKDRIRRHLALGLCGAVVVIALFVAMQFLLPLPMEALWGKVVVGMSESEVVAVFGKRPASVVQIGVVGVGGKKVTRWDYRCGRWHYYIDFDYFGPHGTPAVLRKLKERVRSPWRWDFWRAQAKA